METSFRSRLDRIFGFLNDTENDGGTTHMWSVEERAVSVKNEGLSHEAGEIDSGGDDDNEVSDYADFLKSEDAKRRESRGGRSKPKFFGEEDLAELESGDEEEDGSDDDGDGDDDEDEQVMAGKKKGEAECTEIEAVNRAGGGRGGGDGPLEPLKGQDEDDKDDDGDEEEREVRGMVGMDDTLDFEDEEDEYDKLAVGIEGLEDRLFMSQVRNFGANRQQLNRLPTSFIEMRLANRDMRANHKAALARLEEDDRFAAARAATKDSSQVTKEIKTENSNTVEDPSLAGSQPVRQDNRGEAMDIDGDVDKEEPMEELRNETQQSAPGDLESSLVRDGKHRKPGKRVRFSLDATALTEHETAVTERDIGKSDYPIHVPRTAPAPSTVQSHFATPNRYSKVPDYVKNPSKYIHYTLDWSEEDEEKANMAAFHAARVVSSSSTQDMVTDKHEEVVVESQGPSGSTKISFNPMVTISKRSSKESVGRGLGKDSEGVIAHGIINVAANFDMDSNLGGLITIEDDQDFSRSSELTGQGKFGRVVRRYRNRVTDDNDTDQKLP